ncbi:MAG: mannose-1-phosphate guanylyltransferase [Bacteroidales bacterium]|nr:mannose-1-phosphate guanylyltransferase [Bacteroidales bacterium]
MNKHYYCVIMAGGIGSRFWPLSRASKPKQFLNFSQSGKSFLRLAYERVKGVVSDENILVVTLERYKDLVLEHIPELDIRNLILEPYNRNTAPCLAYSALSILKRDPEAVMCAIPADQVIDDAALYRKTLSAALDYAAGSDSIVTIGIVPTRPDSNFGYIQAGDEIRPGTPIKVKTFTEKPDKALAEVFLKTGEFLWNSGIFVCRADVLHAEIKRHAPALASLWKNWMEILGSPKEREAVERIYTDVTRISLDYAVMEKSENVMTFPAEFGWADIGNWESFYEYLCSHDANSNAVHTAGKSLLREDRRSIIYSNQDGKLIAVKGLEDFMVLDTEDILLVCPRDEVKLKEFLSELAMPEWEDYR